jgi:hypothetical protein
MQTGTNLLNTQGAVVEALRMAYLAEVERIAEALRPRFESGELRCWTDEDGDEIEARRRAGDREWLPPLWRIERFSADWLGMDPKAQGEAFNEGCRVAYLVRLVSPHEDETEDAQPAIGQAMEAVGRDVLDAAGRRGWLQPTPVATPPTPAAPTPEELKGREREARENLAAARQQALQVVPEALRHLSAEDAPAAVVAASADRATSALGFLVGMAHRLAEFEERAS